MSANGKLTAAEQAAPVLNDVIDKDSILYKWASHEDASFHNFSSEEAVEIRESLLSWYRNNRRKLPWRGDPPPFDGSTAGVNSNNNKSKTKKQDKNQPSIKSFFAPTEQSQDSAAIEASFEHQEEETLDESNGKALPVTAYGVWVSEIMLQQTRVEAVIPFYLKWMKRFPTVHRLAEASEDDVNAHWAGLGFYRRARLLHKGAKKVVADYNGELPQTVKELMKIDGIGQYTASAIASIAFDVSVAVVDGNVCRVLSRLKGIANHIKASILKDNVGWELAQQIVSAGGGSHAGEVNQALMELGATYCAPSGTGTDVRDPLKSLYMSSKIGVAFAQEQSRLKDVGFESFPTESYLEEVTNGTCACKLCGGGEGIRTVLNELSLATENLNGSANHLGHAVFPIAPPKKTKREEVLAVAALSYSQESLERWLLVRRPADGLLAGQWEFLSECVWTSESQKKKKKTAAVEVPLVESSKRAKALNGLLEEYATNVEGEANYDWLAECDRCQVGNKPVEHIFSHVRHTMWIEHGDASEYMDSSPPGEWVSAEGKELRWMSEDDMKEVGVTTGVKKILKAVKAQRQSSKRPAKKSKRAVK